MSTGWIIALGIYFIVAGAIAANDYGNKREILSYFLSIMAAVCGVLLLAIAIDGLLS